MEDNEILLIERANDEREHTFERYEKGRLNTEIDEWEDLSFSVYDQIDRYGFLMDKNKLSNHVSQTNKIYKQIERQRIDKWYKMLSKWDSIKNVEKLHYRIYKGIPQSLRSEIWMKILNIEKIIAEKKCIYKKMLNMSRKFSTDVRQIDFDVNRQFREHIFYRERYSIKQQSLFNVLVAYSMYNMEVGYCQGMATVAGILLMFMDEEPAFWALNCLLSDQKYAMHGLFIEGFPKLMRFLEHHDRILKKFLPKLKKHLDNNGLDAILYSLKWFFVVFVERIPFSLCLRVWDIYLVEGERVVTAFAYTILKIHKDKLLKLKDLDQITDFIQFQLHKNFGYDDDYVIKNLQISMDELKRAKMDLPPPASNNELPKRPFGQFIEPSFEVKIGRRKTIFTETEKEVTENVILKNELNNVVNRNDIKEYDEILEDTISQFNTVSDIDDYSNSLFETSRRSITGTSITSTYDDITLSDNKNLYFDYANDVECDNHSIDDVHENNTSIQENHDIKLPKFKLL